MTKTNEELIQLKTEYKTSKNELEELTDDELTQVIGGGSGTIPQGGITFEEYDVLLSDHYYSQEQNFNEVVYVYTASNKMYYTREAFSVVTSTNSWISRNRTPSGVKNPIDNVSGFMSRYRYVLNVQP